MYGFMIGDIFLNAAVLCVILYVVAKNEADYSFAKVSIVTAITGLGAFLIQIFLFEMIGWFTMVLVFALATAAIMTFCWVPLKKTLIVVTLFCLFHVGVEIGVDGIQQYFFPDDSTDGTPTNTISVDEIEAGWAEAKKMLVLSGTMGASDGGYTAMVNDDVLEVNDTVSVHVRTKTYQWRVSSISKHEIQYERLGIQPR